jgi:hypothetical protein
VSDGSGVLQPSGWLVLPPAPSRGPAIARSYRTDGGVTFDPFAARPLRKAVIEACEGSE